MGCSPILLVRMHFERGCDHRVCSGQEQGACCAQFRGPDANCQHGLHRYLCFIFTGGRDFSHGFDEVQILCSFASLSTRNTNYRIKCLTRLSSTLSVSRIPTRLEDAANPRNCQYFGTSPSCLSARGMFRTVQAPRSWLTILVDMLQI